VPGTESRPTADGGHRADGGIAVNKALGVKIDFGRSSMPLRPDWDG